MPNDIKMNTISNMGVVIDKGVPFTNELYENICFMPGGYLF